MVRSPVLVLALLFSLTARAAPPKLLEVVPDETPVHLGIALKMRDPGGLDRLLAAQQDPKSPSYHAWLDPAAFADRFGASEADYAELVTWFQARGFRVTRSPNRLVLVAEGHVDKVRHALAVQPRWAAEAGGRRFRTFEGKVQLPAAIGDRVLHVGGLDTRVRYHRRLNVTVQGTTVQALGPDDLRLQYDLLPLLSGASPSDCLATGTATLANCFTTVVLDPQEGSTTGDGQNCRFSTAGPPFIPPSTEAIDAYFALAGATALFNPIVLPNPDLDFDVCGANAESQLDVEMQSVGAPHAAQIDLVLSPASQVFNDGAQYIVNQLPTAVAVSVSIGLCEAEEAAFFGGDPTSSGSQMQAFQQTLKQGLSEGQMWFAASGDTGADDCNDSNSGTGNGFAHFNATVDFPGSLPEMISVGGTQFSGAPAWNTAGALAAPASEVVWNEQESLPQSLQGGAGGGGQSLYFEKPAYQAGVGPDLSDGRRDVPDISFVAASSTPGVAIYDCGEGQDQKCSGNTTGAGSIDLYGGTSVSSPLAAGIFALLATEVGCQLGDIHATLYGLGLAQQNGGTAVFHDITQGNNSFVAANGVSIGGFPAAVGYDLASGWGTVDVAAMTQSWPACVPKATSSGCETVAGDAFSGWLPLGLAMLVLRRRRT